MAIYYVSSYFIESGFPSKYEYNIFNQTKLNWSSIMEHLLLWSIFSENTSYSATNADQPMLFIFVKKTTKLFVIVFNISCKNNCCKKIQWHYVNILMMVSYIEITEFWQWVGSKSVTARKKNKFNISKNIEKFDSEPWQREEM